MKNMNINGKTKVTDIMAQYPWLLDELIKVNSKFKMANTPIGKKKKKNATVADVSKRARNKCYCCRCKQKIRR